MNVVIVVLNWQKCCKFSQEAKSPKCHDIQIVRTEGSKNTKFICWFLKSGDSCMPTSERPHDVLFLAVHPYKSTRHHQNQQHSAFCTSILLYPVSLLSGCCLSSQKPKYQYRDHLVGQLIMTIVNPVKMCVEISNLVRLVNQAKQPPVSSSFSFFSYSIVLLFDKVS